MTNFQLLSTTELKVKVTPRPAYAGTEEEEEVELLHIRPPPEFDHWTVQPVVSRCTIYATRTALKLILLTSSTTD
jgi:hypothetical protein